MASPISFGDAYLMGKLAWRLGRAFTKGRKSAPADFREVEQQLYSLSAALYALKDAPANDGAALSVDSSQTPATSQPRQTSNGETIATMLQSCKETLKHLEAIVEKYSCIGEPRDSQQPLFKRWSEDLRISWKKIAWTTKGGDLSTLRIQLTVHTNTLSLILGVAIKYVSLYPRWHEGLIAKSSQTKRVENQVDQVATMLKEIHEWFVDNLKDTTSSGCRLAQDTQDPEPSPIAPSQDFNFELLADTGRAEGHQVICHRVSLHPKWKVKNVEATPRHLFVCKCNENCQDCDWQSHQTRVAAYACKLNVCPVGYCATFSTLWHILSLVSLLSQMVVFSVTSQLPRQDHRQREIMDALQNNRHYQQSTSFTNHQENSIARSVFTGFRFLAPEKSRQLIN
jgi:hypothetical protein